jgi:hypothetical protein
MCDNTSGCGSDCGWVNPLVDAKELLMDCLIHVCDMVGIVYEYLPRYRIVWMGYEGPWIHLPIVNAHFREVDVLYLYIVPTFSFNEKRISNNEFCVGAIDGHTRRPYEDYYGHAQILVHEEESAADFTLYYDQDLVDDYETLRQTHREWSQPISTEKITWPLRYNYRIGSVVHMQFNYFNTCPFTCPFKSTLSMYPSFGDNGDLLMHLVQAELFIQLPSNTIIPMPCSITS